MTQILLLPLMVYAACGLILSLTIHILSFFGIAIGGNTLFFALHVGIFPLWLPVVLIAQKMMNGASRKDFWKVALSGCPPWMRYMTRGFLIYAIINFAVFFILSALQSPVKGPDVPSSVLHGFSGHWMLFYSAGLAVLTTAYRKGLSNLRLKCANGHEVGWNDNFCPACGVATVPESGRPQ